MTESTSAKPTPALQSLLSTLKGLPEDAIDVILKQAVVAAARVREEQEQRAKLEAAKASIVKALTGVDVLNFDVQKRGDRIEVKLVGVNTSGRTVSAPKSTPVKDSGMSMKKLVQTYTPDKMDEFNDGDRNRKYALAQAALKAKLAKEKSQA